MVIFRAERALECKTEKYSHSRYQLIRPGPSLELQAQDSIRIGVNATLAPAGFQEERGPWDTEQPEGLTPPLDGGPGTAYRSAS